MASKGFWALQVAPENTYSQIVSEPFRITMATLVAESGGITGGRASLVVRVDCKEYVLCALSAGQTEQQKLDVAFSQDEEVTFSVRGSSACAIQLTGNYLMTEEDYFHQELSKLSKNLSHDELITVLNSMEDPDDEVDSDDIPDSEEEEAATTTKKRALPAENNENTDKTPKKTKPTEKKVKEQSTPSPAENKGESSSQQLQGGLIVKNTRAGSGPAAKPGNKVGVRYIGKLENGKVFDKSTGGKPFVFKLGCSEVIKGWDLGIQGMKVGDERTLTIPPALAYGSRGSPPQIPPNATLYFQVKVVSLQ